MFALADGDVVQKPSVLLRQEAEAWWKVDKNDGAAPELYILSNAFPSLPKFVGGIAHPKYCPLLGTKVQGRIICL